MKKMLMILLAFTVIGMAIPAMADDEIAKVKDLDVNVGGHLDMNNAVDQLLDNQGSQYNTNNGEVLALTNAASVASAGIQIGAFNNVKNEGEGNVGESEAQVDGDVEDNSGNTAEAYSGYVSTDNEAYVDQENNIDQQADAYLDNYQDLYNEVTIDIYNET